MQATDAASTGLLQAQGNSFLVLAERPEVEELADEKTRYDLTVVETETTDSEIAVSSPVRVRLQQKPPKLVLEPV